MMSCWLYRQSWFRERGEPTQDEIAGKDFGVTGDSGVGGRGVWSWGASLAQKQRLVGAAVGGEVRGKWRVVRLARQWEGQVLKAWCACWGAKGNEIEFFNCWTPLFTHIWSVWVLQILSTANQTFRLGNCKDKTEYSLLHSMRLEDRGFH